MSFWTWRRKLTAGIAVVLLLALGWAAVVVAVALAAGREHVRLARRRSALVRRQRQPPGAARLGWIPHAAPPDPRDATRPRAVYVARAQLSHPFEPATQRRLLPRRGLQGPAHVGPQPLRRNGERSMQLASRRIYTGRVVRLDIDTVQLPAVSTGELELIRHPAAPAGERDEFIEVEPHPLSRVLTRIRDGEIRDAKTIVAILYMAGFILGL